MGRQHHAGRHAEAHQTSPDDPPHCVLCGRRIPPQARSSLHHLTPKLKGGTHLGTVRLHQICHSAIHARYTEAEIARQLAAPAALRDDPDLARFVAWVRTKPDDFHAPTRRARGRTPKWK
jgi:5-methylcytosine-specific restriction enzyme A